jgi:hypothetical protein
MAKFNVTFKFDNGNSVINVIESENRQSAFGYITSFEKWFNHDDIVGMTGVNMKNVNSITIDEYHDPRLRKL